MSDELLEQLKHYMTSKQYAQSRGISESTVKYHARKLEIPLVNGYYLFSPYWIERLDKSRPGKVGRPRNKQ